MNKKALAILSAGHLVTDINQTALPALLPFFKEAFNLSYTTAGVILLFGNMTSSVIQPVFGYLSDRRPIKWFLPFAPFIACLGMSLTGFTPTYSLLLLCVIVSGIRGCQFPSRRIQDGPLFHWGEKGDRHVDLFSRRKFRIRHWPNMGTFTRHILRSKGNAGHNHAGNSNGFRLVPQHPDAHHSSSLGFQRGEEGGKKASFEKPKGFALLSCEYCHDQIMGPNGIGKLYSLLLHQLSKRESTLCRETCNNLLDDGCPGYAHRRPNS